MVSAPSPRSGPARPRRERAKLEALLDEVKDVAWSNRDIAPELATIIIDTIRTNEEAAQPAAQLP